MFDPIAYINEPRWQKSNLGLERIRELLERLGRPQDRLRFIHVAGTNGKGSTCAYLASILGCAGYRTGLFTSPYILQFEERIQVAGRNIAYEELREVTSTVREHAEAIADELGEHPTEFELMTAVAFEHFARQDCDAVVCEVGLGGRLDSTNVIEDPLACVITRIGLDHTDVLGSTIAEIAREKAGILKPGAPVVSWPQDEPAMDVIASVAEERGCDLIVPDFSNLEVGEIRDGRRSFSYRDLNLDTRLLGSYQPFNAVLAIEVANVLGNVGLDIEPDAVAKGISSAYWPGRFEVIASRSPTLVIDGGHNPQGASVLADSMRDAFPGVKPVFIMSVLADKDYEAMAAEVLPLAQAVVCASPPNPRALPAAELANVLHDECQNRGVPVYTAENFDAALSLADELAGEDGVVCAFGSLYSVSEIKRAATPSSS